MPTPNPWEERGRDRKVTKLADLLWSHLTDAERTSAELPCVLAAWGHTDRETLANEAGVHAPSDETWDRLCTRIAAMVGSERARVRRLSA